MRRQDRDRGMCSARLSASHALSSPLEHGGKFPGNGWRCVNDKDLPLAAFPDAMFKPPLTHGKASDNHNRQRYMVNISIKAFCACNPRATRRLTISELSMQPRDREEET